MPGTNTNREWTVALEYTKDRDGNPCPINNVGNLVTILENDERLRGKIRYNDFSSIIEHDELPWNGKGEWVDDDNAELRFLLEDFRRSGFQKDKVMDALAIVAKKHRYHPIREYLDALKWDGIPRIETLFIDYFHTDDIPLYRNASICFFAKAVQRIYEPGCDLQFMLEFLGPQGTGKSAFGKALVGNKWFNDSDIDVGSKDGYMALANSWLIEIAEGDSFNKKEASAVKKFISSTSDTYRPPYARSNVVIQRQCVFIGTTNEEVFLNDPTGNRRFWPIETKATAIDAVKRIKWLESIADQLWAEAVALYITRMSEIDQLVIDTGHQMMELQEQHNQIDPLLDDLQEFLDTKLPSCWDKLSTYEKRNFYDSNEAGREDLYRQKLISHQNDRLRMRVSAFEFVSEFLGVDKSSPKYVPSCKHAHRLLASMEGWERDPEEHRYEGRGRIFYNRIVVDKPSDDLQSKEKTNATPAYAEMDVNANGLPFGPVSEGEDMPF